MVHGENTTVIQYLVRHLHALPASAACTLEVRPLIAFRDYHSTTHENGALNPSAELEHGLIVCAPYAGLPKLCLAHTGGEAHHTGHCYRNFEYAAEKQPRPDYRE